MRDILGYIRAFIAGLRKAYILPVMLIMAVLIFLNYTFHIERTIANIKDMPLLKLTGFYILYFVPFAAAFLLHAFSAKSRLSTGLVCLILIAPAIFAIRACPDGSLFTGPDSVFYNACFGWILRSAVTIFLVYLVWRIKDRRRMPVYGTKALHSAKPYFIMLLLMIPLIALAAGQADFLKTYPRAKILDGNLNDYHALKYLFYELCYGFDFISVEFFFRGFLILAFARYAGVDCILPAACFYCAIHFGKPAAEAISSFFGGIILGIVSYHTQSVRGGLIVHLGIAWLMEIAGALAHL